MEMVLDIEPTNEVNRPTPELLRRCLAMEAHETEAIWARKYVLAARETVTTHARKAWWTKARSERSVLVNQAAPVCGCGQCEWMTKISKVRLPEETPTYWVEDLNG